MERYFLHSHCGRVIDDAVYVDFVCVLKGKLREHRDTVQCAQQGWTGKCHNVLWWGENRNRAALNIRKGFI